MSRLRALLAVALLGVGAALPASAETPPPAPRDQERPDRWKPTASPEEDDALLTEEEIAIATERGSATADDAVDESRAVALRDALFTGAAIAIVVLGLMASMWRTRRAQRRNEVVMRAAVADGLDVPPSLHPEINPALCIGCGKCTDICPDQSVLGVIGNRAQVTTPANCVGHGLCMKSCPVGAIQLVFGTADHGFELPRYDGAYESNAPGIYVAGELGGMGLIANAFDQAIEAMDNIVADLRRSPACSVDAFDVLIVGAGPAGLGASLRALELGARYVCVEQGTWGGAINAYPRKKLVMTRPIRVPLYGPVKLAETSKEGLVELWGRVIEETGVAVRENTRVDRVTEAADHFIVETSAGPIAARRVLLAIGRRGTPRKLGVPGEDQPHVVYALVDPAPFAGRSIVVTGGGDVACETALALCEQPDTRVALVYRGAVLKRPKAKNRERVERARAQGQLRVVLEGKIRAIAAATVELTVGADPTVYALPADDVFVAIGGVPPTKFLNALGIDVVTLRGESMAA